MRETERGGGRQGEKRDGGIKEGGTNGKREGGRKRRKEGKKEEDEREAGKERGSQEGNNAIPGDTEPLRAATRPSLHRLRHTVQCIFAPLLINGVLKPRCPNWIWYSASGFLMGRRIL